MLVALIGFAVVLALVLAAMLLSTLGLALRTHMRAVDTGRTLVEDARLAHVIMDRSVSLDIASICKASGLAYPVRDGIPVMLETEARQLTADEKLG